MSTDRYLNKIVLNKMTREQFEQIDKNPDEFYAVTDNTILGGISMFDTILKDHVLTYEESKGLALQGTYVYKDAIAGSRYGYPDFYNKCVEEYDEAVEERWEQPVLTGNTTQVTEGEIVCTASSYYTIENRQPYCAMDGVKSGATTTLDAWTTHNTKTGWWQVKFPYKLKITGLKYYAPYSTTVDSYIATTGRFYTSSDKSTPIGDELSTTTRWEIVDVSNIPVEGIVTDTIYFDITDSGNYGGIGELEIEATRVGIVKHPNGHVFYDISVKDQIDELFASTGSAWFYGIDTENERVFLPRDKYFAVTGGVVGNGMTLGLTNGVANFGLSHNVSHTFVSNGKTYGTSVGTSGESYVNADSNAMGVGVTTDPTKSGIVLDPNEDKYLYICVGNTTNYEGMTDVVNQGMDILEQVNLGIESRVKLDGSNAEFPYIIDSYVNGTSWYRVYSDGWCEQGGVTVVPTSAGAVITFLKPFKDNNYWGMVNLSATDLGAAYYEAGIVKGSKTTTSMTILSRNYGETNIREYYWEVKGYIN